MTNYEKYKELLNKYTLCSVHWGVTKEKEIKICTKELSCADCIFKTLAKTCPVYRLDWLDEEYEEPSKNEDKVGYKDDELFLMSIKEYEKYKAVIPECKIDWWLRSPGDNDKLAALVGNAGYVINSGGLVSYCCVGIRPALRVNTYGCKIGAKLIYKNFTFTIIDKDLCIATMPIAFDKFDDVNNDYERSDVRRFLLER